MTKHTTSLSERERGLRTYPILAFKFEILFMRIAMKYKINAKGNTES